MKAVLVEIDKRSIANAFFRIERVLSALGIPYQLLVRETIGAESLILRETAGRASSAPSAKPHGEQDGAEQPPARQDLKSEHS